MAALVTLTPAALAQLRAALAAADDPELALRAAARRTDDGAIEFGLGLDEPREQDEQVRIDDDVKVLVSVASRELIAGTEIDYVEVAPGEFRFVFFREEQATGAAPDGNPAGCGNCGCGGSVESKPGASPSGTPGEAG